MTRKEFIDLAVIDAEAEYKKIQAAESYRTALETIIADLKSDGFKLIVMGNTVRVTF